MSITTTDAEPTTTTPAKPRRRKPGQCVLVHNVEWDAYEKMLDAFAGKRGVRLTYDRGDLEIMAPSYEHENDGTVLAQMVWILAEELGLPLNPGGATTLRKKLKKRGIEPDHCFWLATATQFGNVRTLDLRKHPPPDLAIEVDVSHSSLDRFAIYRALKVGELWRLDGDELRFFALDAKATYGVVQASRTFPIVSPAELFSHLQRARATGNKITALREFRAWVQERIAQSAAKPPE